VIKLGICNKMRRLGWRPWHLGLAAGVVAVAVVVCLEAWADIFHLARRDEESSQIWLAFPIALYLAFVRMPRLVDAPRRHFWIGPVLVVLGWVMMWQGDINLWQSVWHAGAVTVAVGAALSILGGSVARRLLPALLALGFLVPIPNRVRQPIATQLQPVVATATVASLGVIGIDAGQTGNVITINGEQVAVAEACNGMRGTFSLFATCFALAFGLPLRMWARIALLAAAPLVAVIFNIVRLVPTVWLYGNAPNHLADVFHDLAGWGMLFVAMFTVIGLLHLLSQLRLPVYRVPLAAVRG
jgi:exosortase